MQSRVPCCADVSGLWSLGYEIFQFHGQAECYWFFGIKNLLGHAAGFEICKDFSFGRCKRMQAWTSQETYPMLSQQIARAAASRAEQAQDQPLRITTKHDKGVERLKLSPTIKPMVNGHETDNLNWSGLVNRKRHFPALVACNDAPCIKCTCRGFISKSFAPKLTVGCIIERNHQQ